MSTFSRKERDFIGAIKEKKRAREAAQAKRKADIKASFDVLANAPLKPTKILMSQADYDDIVKWSGGQP